MEPISGKILGVSTSANYYLQNLRTEISWVLVLDVLVVAIIFYWAYIFLKETRAIRILYGLFFLLAFIGIGKLFDLILLTWILKGVTAMLIVAIPVVFQPELRTALEKLGRTKLLGESAFSKNDSQETIDKIIKAVLYFQTNKMGALIVLKRGTGLKEYIDNGVTINSRVSAELIESIFSPKSPLHDGAIIISDNRIVSARSILPVSEINLGQSMGTRHKAGLAITEISDCVSIIVSEETSKISLAVSGKIESNLSIDQLRRRLIYHYSTKIEKK